MCGGNNNPTTPIKPVDTVVTLTVDTAKINQTNKNNEVTFTDNQSDPAENPGDPRQYVSSVNKNAWITWIVVAANGTDTVCITDVSKKTVGGGSNILVVPIGPPINCQARGRIVNTQVTGNELYTITFNVVIAGVTTPYSIDPQLKMN